MPEQHRLCLISHRQSSLEEEEEADRLLATVLAAMDSEEPLILFLVLLDLSLLRHLQRAALTQDLRLRHRETTMHRDRNTPTRVRPQDCVTSGMIRFMSDVQ